RPRGGGVASAALRGTLRAKARSARGGHPRWGPVLGAGRVAARRKPRRRFDETGKQRGFREIKLLGGLGKIALSGGLDSIGAGAEIDPVEIELQNLAHAELALEPQRKHQLLQLAPERAFLGQEQVLGELLRDRRAALGDMAAQQVGNARAQKPDGINTKMLIETVILDRDERVEQMGRKTPDGHVDTAHLAAAGERPPVDAN